MEKEKGKRKRAEKMAKKAVKSIEEDVEDVYKRKLSDMGFKIYRKNAEMNNEIDGALKKAESKSGGKVLSDRIHQG